jgi:hypothetical protein
MDSGTASGSKPEKVEFKRKKAGKSFRQRKVSDEEEEAEEEETHRFDGRNDWEKLEELKALQNMKKRVNRGVNVVDLLNVRNNEPKTETGGQKDKAQVGGMTDAKSLASELDLGHTFSVETNRRDEDADMMKYIEEELAKRKGQAQEEAEGETRPVITEDHVFNTLPSHLLESSQKKSEEMLSNQMLSGIPEVDLGVDERIRNIEATEDAKLKWLESRTRRHTASASNLVPTNVAVNFVQHNRFSIQQEPGHGPPSNKKQRVVKPVVATVEEPVVVIGDEPRQRTFKQHPQGSRGFLKFPGKEKATDDYHYERFRKQFRK